MHFSVRDANGSQVRCDVLEHCILTRISHVGRDDFADICLRGFPVLPSRYPAPRASNATAFSHLEFQFPAMGEFRLECILALIERCRCSPPKSTNRLAMAGH